MHVAPTQNISAKLKATTQLLYVCLAPKKNFANFLNDSFIFLQAIVNRSTLAKR